jgi:hypothetical protein
MEKPERYIVHIYRREGSGKAMRVAGLLEKVGSGPQRRFTSGTELWNLLNSSTKPSRRTVGQGHKARQKPPL